MSGAPENASVPLWARLALLGAAAGGVALAAEHLPVPSRPAAVCNVSGDTLTVPLEGVEQAKDRILPPGNPCRPNLDQIVSRLVERERRDGDGEVDIPFVTPQH